MNGVDILEHAGEGYKRVVDGPLWTLAGLNYAARFDARNIVELERHNLTDETFVLLRGSATLLTLADGEGPVADRVTRLPMEPLKYYNVRAGRWHGIVVSEDARVLVGENADTSKANTDYLRLATGEIFQK